MSTNATLTDLSLSSNLGVYEVMTEFGIVYEVHVEPSELSNAGRMVISRDPSKPDELEGRHPLTIVDMMVSVGVDGWFSLVDLVSGAKKVNTPRVTAITKVA